jgi:hypothetical protein
MSLTLFSLLGSPRPSPSVTIASLRGNECIRPRTPLSLEDARRLVKCYVDHYNDIRLNSAIGYITPKDMLAGHQQEIQADQDRKLEAARKQRKNRRQPQGLLPCRSRFGGKEHTTHYRTRYSKSVQTALCSRARERKGASKTTKTGYKAVKGSTIEALPPGRIAAVKVKNPGHCIPVKQGPAQAVR